MFYTYTTEMTIPRFNAEAGKAFTLNNFGRKTVSSQYVKFVSFL